MEKQQEQAVKMAVKRIKMLSFKINEKAHNSDLKDSGIHLEQRLVFEPKDDTADLTLHVFYKYKDSDEILIDSEIQTIFHIEELNRFLKENSDKINIPGNAMITMVSLAISHARAILALEVSGTVYQDMLMPILNGDVVARHFFGEQKELTP